MDISQHNPFKQKPEVVIFDLCGTLMNSKELDHEAINYTLKTYGKEPWNITRKKKDPLKSMKNNFPNFFEEQSDKAYNTYIEYLTNNINTISFFDKASQHLKLLKQMGIKTAVITNRDEVFIKALKNHREYQEEILPFLDLVLTADEAGVTKPSTKIIEFALKKLEAKKTDKSKIAFVGDAFADMQVAIDYNCTPILLTATTADITDKFLEENKDKIYIALSHKDIVYSLMDINRLAKIRKKIATKIGLKNVKLPNSIKEIEHNIANFIFHNKKVNHCNMTTYITNNK